MRPAVSLSLCMLVLLANGCTRTRYRMAADRDSYRVLQEKAACANKALPPGYSVQPDPRARFYDPTNPDCPQLPVQRPVLYGYQLPELLSARGPANDVMATAPQPNKEPIASPAPVEVQPAPSVNPPPPEVPMPLPVPSDLPSITPVEQDVVPAGFLVEPAERPQEKESPPANTTPPAAPSRPFSVGTQRMVTIPEKAWAVLPEICLDRMFEFESLRAEYKQSFPQASLDRNGSDKTQRLTLANLMELAIINSREYQTRKEVLYRTALAVTRQRYQFDLNPTPFGNGTAANYRHLRDGGVEVNRLTTPTGVGVQQTLASGANSWLVSPTALS